MEALCEVNHTASWVGGRGTRLVKLGGGPGDKTSQAGWGAGGQDWLMEALCEVNHTASWVGGRGTRLASGSSV